MNIQKICNKRIIAITLLSFSSGLPLALTGSTLQAWYTMAGVSIMTIGALSLVGQPYVYKFLWAPLLDRFMPLNMGRRRSWMFVMQLLLVVGLLIMAFLHPGKDPWLMATIALCVAFFSASQDVAIDAYRTDILKIDERGLGAAMNTIGYRFAMLISGAVALIFASTLGWRVTYIIMACLMALELLVTYWSPCPTERIVPPRTLSSAIVEPWKDFLSRKSAVIILIFIVIYKLSDAFAISLNTYFLLHGIGFSLIELGSVAKITFLAGSLIGALVGGLLMPRLGMYRSLMIFGFLQMASNLLFIPLVYIGKSIGFMAFSLFAESFCGGLSTVAFVAFLMALCDRRFTATQYALLSALAAVGRVFVGPEAAFMVEHLGWVQFYLWTFVMGIPSLGILWWLRQRIDFSAEKVAHQA